MLDIIPPRRYSAMVSLFQTSKTVHRRKKLYRRSSVGWLRMLLFSKAAFIFLLATFVVPLSAFEAHVVNVTATIERPPAQCDALSIGYWSNHEGCSGGEGSSIWESQIQQLSANFSGVFSTASGSDICSYLEIPNCPSGGSTDGRRCRARAQVLADELNVVSNRLELSAFIAGADDGNVAFDNFGFGYNTTVEEALLEIEATIANNSSTKEQLRDAAYIAQRIYVFYEDENPNYPFCVFDPSGEAALAGQSGFSLQSSNASLNEDEDEGDGVSDEDAGGSDSLENEVSSENEAANESPNSPETPSSSNENGDSENAGNIQEQGEPDLGNGSSAGNENNFGEQNQNNGGSSEESNNGSNTNGSQSAEENTNENTTGNSGAGETP